MDASISTYPQPTMAEAEMTIYRQALKITQLENENAALRSKSLPQLHSGSGGDLAKSNAIASRSSADTGQHVPVATYQAALQRIAEVEAKFRDSKNLIKEWKVYIDHLKKRGQLPEDDVLKKPPPLRTSSEPPQDMADGTVNKRAKELVALRPYLTKASPADERVDSPTSPRLPSSPPPRSSGSPRLPRVTSSQTTAEDDETQNIPSSPKKFMQGSDDEPQIVSTRPVKRKGGVSRAAEPPARRIKIKKEPNSLEGPIELKSDEFSSPRKSPVRPTRQMSDLDAIGAHMATPHRRNRFSLRAVSEEVTRPAPALRRNESSRSDGDFDARNTITTFIKSEGSGERQNESDEQNADTIERSSRIEVRPPDTALRPISVNVPKQPRINAAPGEKKSKLRRTGAKDHVGILSEAGDEDSQALKAQQQQDTIPPEVNAGDRLDHLLNEQSPKKTPKFLRQPVNVARSRANPNPYIHLPTPESAYKKPPPGKQNVVRGERARTPDEPAPAILPEQSPLRSRHVSSLRLDDFKINPKYMGTDFAFSDTLRGRDNRRTLHTCTRPDCCGGAMKKAIAMGGTSLSGKTDGQALETFLGPDWEEQISNFGPDKRKEIKIQAHVFCFSNQHGKHKQAFERRSTPPGFWDTDFPATQQVAQNRAKAQEMEKEAVADRWREAMREGGRWLFRDE